MNSRLLMIAKSLPFLIPKVIPKMLTILIFYNDFFGFPKNNTAEIPLSIFFENNNTCACVCAFFIVPLQHVYLISHILHDCAIALPYSGMATLLDHSAAMSSQHALCSICIYGAGTCAALLRHHALWLLVWAKAIACN